MFRTQNILLIQDGQRPLEDITKHAKLISGNYDDSRKIHRKYQEFTRRLYF
jgi:hypothetical protein